MLLFGHNIASLRYEQRSSRCMIVVIAVEETAVQPSSNERGRVPRGNGGHTSGRLGGLHRRASKSNRGCRCRSQWACRAGMPRLGRVCRRLLKQHGSERRAAYDQQLVDGRRSRFLADIASAERDDLTNLHAQDFGARDWSTDRAIGVYRLARAPAQRQDISWRSRVSYQPGAVA